MSDQPTNLQPHKKRFFDEGIKKNENLMKAVTNFDVEKKASAPQNKIFMFRQKKQLQ